MIRKVMEQIPSIKSVMTPFPYLIDAAAAVEEADAMMRRHDFRHLPVTENNALIGLISADDVFRALDAGGGCTVRDAGIAEAKRFELSEPLDHVLGYMAETHVECVLVVKQGKLVGIFTLTDACRCFAEFLLAIFPPKDGDDAA